MNKFLSPRQVTRRRFLQGLGLTLGAGLLSTGKLPPAIAAPLPAASQPWLFSGVNYPWTNYSLDFGQNGWGHAGLTTSGWTHQTYINTQGFIATRVVQGHAHSGRGALAITADLVAPHANQSQGEVYVDLRYHAPPGITAPLNMTGKTARCWLYLPPGSAGASSAPNGVQLVFKSEGADGTWYTWLSPWVNIQSDWAGTYHEFTANLAEPPGHVDPAFDSTRIVAVGIKVATNSQPATLKDTFYLDDFVLETNPPVRFDFEQTEVDRDFATLSCTASVVRVFVFGDGRASPEFTGTGAVDSPAFDDFFFADFDALVQAAVHYNLKLIPVLLDYQWCYKASTVSGVQTGGHAAIIRDTALQQSFINNALKLLIQRYVNTPQILAWDIINEPEWVIDTLNPGKTEPDYVTLAQMQSFVKACADAIHAISPSLAVTVGSGKRKWVNHWLNYGLDLYQFHWYDDQPTDEVFPWLPYQDLGLDKPCFVGEVATVYPAKAKRTVQEYLSAAQAGGYSGLLVWSYRAKDDYSQFSAVNQSLGQYCTRLPGVMKK